MSARSRSAHLGAAIAGCLLFTAACGSSGEAGSSTSGPAAGSSSGVPDTAAILQAVTKDAQLAATVKTVHPGTMEVGSNVQSPPNDFYASDGKTAVGFEVDLAKAIAAKLGLTVHYNDMPFGSLITSLQSGRLDMTIAGSTTRRRASSKSISSTTSIRASRSWCARAIPPASPGPMRCAARKSRWCREPRTRRSPPSRAPNARSRASRQLR